MTGRILAAQYTALPFHKGVAETAERATLSVGLIQPEMMGELGQHVSSKPGIPNPTRDSDKM